MLSPTANIAQPTVSKSIADRVLLGYFSIRYKLEVPLEIHNGLANGRMILRMDSSTIAKALPTVAVGIATYLGGLFTEPLKKWLGNRSERRRLRTALYAELADNIFHLTMYAGSLQHLGEAQNTGYPSIDKWLATDVYQVALKQQPVLLREIKESRSFSLFFMGIEALKTKLPADQFGACRGIIEWVTVSVTSETWSVLTADSNQLGLFSRRMLNKHWPFMQHSFRGPILSFVGKWYEMLIMRNWDKRLMYTRPQNIFGMIRAIIRGVPGNPHPYPPELLQVLERMNIK